MLANFFLSMVELLFIPWGKLVALSCFKRQMQVLL
jgi:hypothetical protein